MISHLFLKMKTHHCEVAIQAWLKQSKTAVILSAAKNLVDPSASPQDDADSEIASPNRPSGTGRPSGRPPLDQPAASLGTTPRNDKRNQQLHSSIVILPKSGGG